MRFRLVFIVFLGLAFGCSDLDYPQEFTIVLTEEIINITPEGAEFVGSVRSLGSGQHIVKYGFVWGETNNPSLTSSYSSVTDNIKEGRFSKLIKNDLSKGKDYYVRAFIQTSSFTVYGNQLRFASKGSQAPMITGFTPKEGFDGTEITIRGKNFSQGDEGNEVTVGALICKVISATDSVLEVELPASKHVGDYKIGVKVADHTIVSEEYFTILGPRIRSISKLSGRVGDLLTIGGEYFDIASHMIMHFGSPEQWTTNYSVPVVKSAGQFTTYIPDYPDFKGQVELYSQLSTGEKTFVFPAEFTIVDSWAKTGEQLPLTNHDGYSSVKINHSIYIVGGRTLYEFDILTKQWTKRADFPGAYRFYGTAFTYDGKLYYGFGEGQHEPMAGYNGKYYNDLWVYNPLTKAWSYAGAVPLTPRSRMLSMVINHKIYLGFGTVQWPNHKTFTDFWEYDLSSNTTKSIESPVKGFTFKPTSFVVNNKGYLIGLERPGVSWNRTADFWEFDPATYSWSRKDDFPDMINGEEATLRNGKGLVLVSGVNVGNHRVYEYDPGQDIWIKRQSLHGTNTSGNFMFAHYHNSKLYFATKQLWELSFD